MITLALGATEKTMQNKKPTLRATEKQCITKCRLLTPSAERCLMNNLVFNTTNKVLLTEPKYLQLGLQTNYKSFFEKILKMFYILFKHFKK